jgi:hypothetical protein
MENEEYCGCKTRGGIIISFCEEHFELYWGKRRKQGEENE